jgi:hypothetical protein
MQERSQDASTDDLTFWRRLDAQTLAGSVT